MFVKDTLAPATIKTMMPSVMSVTPLQRFASRSVRLSCAVDHERTVLGAPGPAGGGGASAPTGGGKAGSADIREEGGRGRRRTRRKEEGSAGGAGLVVRVPRGQEREAEPLRERLARFVSVAVKEEDGALSDSRRTRKMGSGEEVK